VVVAEDIKDQVIKEILLVLRAMKELKWETPQTLQLLFNKPTSQLI